MTAQGFRLSDSDSTQKSWPSGAPARAAAACAAEIPGITTSSTPCQAGSSERCSASRPRSPSRTPPDRRTTRSRPSGRAPANASAMPRPVHFRAIVGGVDRLPVAERAGHPQIGRVADDVLGGSERRCAPPAISHPPAARTEPDHGQPAAAAAERRHRERRGGDASPTGPSISGGATGSGTAQPQEARRSTSARRPCLPRGSRRTAAAAPSAAAAAWISGFAAWRSAATTAATACGASPQPAEGLRDQLRQIGGGRRRRRPRPSADGTSARGRRARVRRGSLRSTGCPSAVERQPGSASHGASPESLDPLAGEQIRHEALGAAGVAQLVALAAGFRAPPRTGPRRWR